MCSAHRVLSGRTEITCASQWRFGSLLHVFYRAASYCGQVSAWTVCLPTACGEGVLGVVHGSARRNFFECRRKSDFLRAGNHTRRKGTAAFFRRRFSKWSDLPRAPVSFLKSCLPAYRLRTLMSATNASWLPLGNPCRRINCFFRNFVH